MDKRSYIQASVGSKYFTNFKGTIVEVSEGICNFIQNFIMDVLLIHAEIKIRPC